MRLLLIAYEFPPSPSPQALRWLYLVRELHALGHEIHVLTVDLGPDNPGLPPLPEGVEVHRSFAGPFRALPSWLRKRRSARQSSSSTPSQNTALAEQTPARPRFLQRCKRWIWQYLQRCKYWLWQRLLVLAERMIFPDLRGEWLYFGKARLRELLRHQHFDIIIASHEPATSLQLGLYAAQHAGIPLVADLGDPVLAGYTAKHWRRKAFALEREICQQATHLTLTADSAAALLQQRHHPCAPITVLRQGFAGHLQHDSSAPAFGKDSGYLELLYTGSFYSFRRPETLLKAVLSCPDVRLHIASINPPPFLLDAAKAHPHQIRLLGFIDHLHALQLQRQADVLINISNADSSQVPGKLFEYAGALRPILHIRQHDDDPSAHWIAQHQRGWNCDNDENALLQKIQALVRAKHAGTLEQGLDLSMARVQHESWASKAKQLEQLLQQIFNAHHAVKPHAKDP